MFSAKRSVAQTAVSTTSSSGTTASVLSWLFFGTQIVGGLLLAVTLLIYANQDRLLYFPDIPNMPKSPDDNPPGFTSPGDWTKAGQLLQGHSIDGETARIPYEDVMIRTSDGQQIHSWLMLQDDAENCPTLIYFHGNAGNMGFRLQNAATMFATAKINILMMDYRGYGKSTGSPNEAGLKLDAEAVLYHVRDHPRLKKSPIVVFGRSLGGAVSFYLAEKFPSLVAGVIVENTFLSISQMVDILMPYLKILKPYVLRIKWNNDEIVPLVRQPILFISGEKDELVPPFHMVKLYDLAKSSMHRQLYSVPCGRHNDTWEKGGSKYYLTLKTFFDNHIRTKPTAEETPAAPRDEPAKIYSDAEEDDVFLVVHQSTANIIPTMTRDFHIGAAKEE